MRFENRVAVVTGASRGIGAACALALAREGCAIVAAARSVTPHPKLPGTLQDTVTAVEEVGARAIAAQVDVRDDWQVADMVERAVEAFGRIDYLVNNAGAVYWAPLAEWPVERYDLVMDVNLRGAFLCSRAVLPVMRDQGCGHVLMISPPLNEKAAVGKAPYIASKFGTTLLARAIDAENADAGVCASALWPITGIRTAATVNLRLGSEEEWRTPDIVADAAAELLARDPRTTRFRAWLDEEVLAEAGITDLDPYSCVPGSSPTPMSIRLVDPDWERG
ncbi:MAG: SDR family oxidoreductase [Gemmatimonadota bacterium]|jgi:citronellol/citronellal dehydrogenase